MDQKVGQSFYDASASTIDELIKLKCDKAREVLPSGGSCSIYGGWQGVEYGQFICQKINDQINGIYLNGNDLYTVSSSQVGADPVLKKLGSNNSVSGLYVVATNASTGSYDVTEISDYQSLTTDNFIFSPTSIEGVAARNPGSTQGSGATKTLSPTMSYNASTGILTLSNFSNTWSASQDPYQKSLTLKGTIYCIY